MWPFPEACVPHSEIVFSTWPPLLLCGCPGSCICHIPLKSSVCFCLSMVCPRFSSSLKDFSSQSLVQRMVKTELPRDCFWQKTWESWCLQTTKSWKCWCLQKALWKTSSWLKSGKRGNLYSGWPLSLGRHNPTQGFTVACRVLPRKRFFGRLSSWPAVTDIRGLLSTSKPLLCNDHEAKEFLSPMTGKSFT